MGLASLAGWRRCGRLFAMTAIGRKQTVRVATGLQQSSSVQLFPNLLEDYC